MCIRDSSYYISKFQSFFVRAQLKCDVEEKSGEEVDIRPMRFFVRFFFCFLVEKAKGAKRGGRETLTRVYL